MTEHRKIQRTLFRMQHDPAFAEALRRRDDAAVLSTGLGAEDLAMLLAAPRAGIEADAGGRRREQFLRNVGSEHALTLARAERSDPGLASSFPASDEFHAAIARDLSLPLAFARHALRRAAPLSDDPLLLALARLEHAMASARRGPFHRPAPPAGSVALAPSAEVLTLPGGALAAAAALRAALDARAAPDARAEPLPDPPVSFDERERVLVVAGPRPSPHRLGDASVELLSPLAGHLLEAARDALDARALDAFRARHDVGADELEAFLASLAAEGIVVGR